MNFNKRVNGSWADVPHYIMGTATDTLTTLPAVLYPNAVTATVGLKGNMSQTGTPSPTTPIQPQETGDETGNLYNLDKFTKSGGSYTISGAEITMEGNSNANNYYYPDIVYPAGTYTISFTGANSTTYMILGSSYDLANATINSTALSANSSAIATRLGVSYARYVQTFTNTKVIYSDVPFKVVFAPTATTWVISNVMMNIGGTAISYEPDGYKIPISSNSTTTPVYLGDVQSTRQIKKYIFTGQENWTEANTRFYNDTIITDYAVIEGTIAYAICTHYGISEQTSSASSVADMTLAFKNGNPRIYIRDSSISGGAEGFKAYLQQQYANGTPVTIWYVLATPQTAVVNEPIRKIGDYADEVSGITIPTIAGANSFDVLTTLKPSEVTVNYKGWHSVVDVHERESGQWD